MGSHDLRMSVHAITRSSCAVPVHLLLGGWILVMLWLGGSDPERYRLLLQEDRIVEWGTVWLFLAAGVLGFRRSIRQRRLFDGLVALFCLFVAGEEFSWGQRLIGYSAPEFFLRNNLQQELNLHNLPDSVRPGWILMLALGGYGVLLPLLSLASSARAFIGRAGATPPPLSLGPWYASAIAMLWWYPFTLTAEWVELLSGALFVMSTTAIPTTLWAILAMTVGVGATMTSVAGALESERDESRIACTRTEPKSLADDVTAGEAGTRRLWDTRRLHKRIWSSIGDGDVGGPRLRGFSVVPCGDSAGKTADVRRRYGIDPWGSPYWLRVEPSSANDRRVTVYSFGPNRRRDVPDTGDDIVATRIDRARWK